MARFRVSSVSLFAFLAAFAPAASWASDSLPSTAYSMTGVANSLATSQDSAISSRLRALRNGDRLTPSKIVRPRAPVIFPLQENVDTLHDLRAGTKTPTMTNPHGTLNNYRTVSPAMYQKENATYVQPSSTTQVGKAIDETSRLIGIGAGAPNLTTRGMNAPVLRNVPNMADRAATEVLDFAGDLGGQGQTYATARPGKPRYEMLSPRDKYMNTASAYRGQPLSRLSSNTQVLHLQPSQANVSTAAQPTPLATYKTTTNKYAPPIIYGPNDPLPPDMATHQNATPLAQAPRPLTAETIQSAPPVMTLDPTPAPQMIPTPQEKAQETFLYKKIDQGAALTTPHLGSPVSSKTTVHIQQPNAYALTSFSQMNLGGYAAPRAATDTGSLLWSSEDDQSDAQSQPSAQDNNETNKEFMVAQASTNTQQAQVPTYGTRAVPLGINTDRRWGFFMTGNTGFGSDELQTGNDKTSTVTSGFTAGVDYRKGEKDFIGLALTYAHSSFTTGTAADLQGNSVAISLYGTSAYATDAYLDTYISVGYHSLDSERGILANNSKATSSPSGFQFGNRTETGYVFKNGDLNYGPFAAFRFAYSDFDSYTETGAGAYNLKVGGHHNTSAIGSLGVDGSHRFALSNGGVVLPGLRVAYNHEFGDNQTDIEARLADLSANSFTTKSKKKSRDWLNLSPSVSASLPNDWTLVAQYEHDFFRSDVNENLFNVSAHYKW